MADNTENVSNTARGGGPLLSPKRLADHYELGLTRVYWECKYGVLKDVCIHWGRRLYVPARAAARIFGEEGE
jgi:hypothetical protein